MEPSGKGTQKMVAIALWEGPLFCLVRKKASLNELAKENKYMTNITTWYSRTQPFWKGINSPKF